MSRLLTAILLLLVAGSALAQSPTDVTGIIHSFTPPGSDYSVGYLGQIFGTVGNVLQGTSGQILGHLFEWFNKGIMAVAALWLGYTTLTTALRASQEGSFMGQNRNVPVMLLRIAFGFALIIPSSTTGYNLLQDIFMKIVIEGVGLADHTWDAALHYLEYGGTLYIPPGTMTTDTKLINAALGPDATTGASQGPVTTILQDEVCMLKSAEWKGEQGRPPAPNDAGGGSFANPSDAPVTPFHPIYHASTGVIDFPGAFSDSSSACGSVKSYYAVNPPASTFTAEQKSSMQSYSWSALKQLVISLLPAAQQYVHEKLYNFPSSGASQNAKNSYGSKVDVNAKTVFFCYFRLRQFNNPLSAPID